MSLPPSKTLSSRGFFFKMTYWKIPLCLCTTDFYEVLSNLLIQFWSSDAIFFYPKTQLSKFAKENTGCCRKAILNEAVHGSLLGKWKSKEKKTKGSVFFISYIYIKKPPLSLMLWLETKWTLETTISFLAEILSLSLNKGPCMCWNFYLKTNVNVVTRFSGMTKKCC